MYQTSDELMKDRFNALFYNDLCENYQKIKKYKGNELKLDCQEFVKKWTTNVF